MSFQDVEFLKWLLLFKKILMNSLKVAGELREVKSSWDFLAVKIIAKSLSFCDLWWDKVRWVVVQFIPFASLVIILYSTL